MRIGEVDYRRLPYARLKPMVCLFSCLVIMMKPIIDHNYDPDTDEKWPFRDVRRSQIVMFCSIQIVCQFRMENDFRFVMSCGS